MLPQLRQLWSGLDRRAQTVVIAVAVLSVAAVIGLLRAGSNLAMTPLYTDMAPEDAASVVEKLKADKIPYRLSAGGGTVQVPADKVYELRVALAKDGLPASGHVGFEIFDKSGLPGTQFSNQVNYQRAVQGELARTITAMDEIRSARVHLVLPEESLFAPEAKATASVVVQPEGARTITPEVSAAIAQIVAGAVQGVKAEEITIADTAGRVLHGPQLGGSAGALAGTQLEIRQQYEERLAQNLQTMLDAVLGPSKSVVRVRADLDCDTQEVHTEALMPVANGRGMVTSEKLREETYQGNREGTGGVAGVEPNLGAPAMASQQSRGGSYVQRDETREYQYSKNETQVVKAPGRVKALSVAAILDEELPSSAEQQVRQLLSAAAGVDESRGDSLAVQRMKINAAEVAKTQETELAKTAASAKWQGVARGALRYGTTLIAAVLLFMSVNMILKQFRPVMALQTAEPRVIATAADDDDEPRPEDFASLPRTRQRLRDLAQQDVDAVADRLQTLLQE